MKLAFDLQKNIHAKHVPAQKHFKEWINAAAAAFVKEAEITLRIVDKDESQHLNRTYRSKDKPTNVLSFPYELTDEYVCGDMVMCVPVIAAEALDQRKDIMLHWAHLTVHGTLHLLGFDHEKDKDAEAMEALEKKILKKLGFENPYK